jgi:hypothetical protein
VTEPASHYAELQKHYASQPREVSIETQALCNARCVFCPYPTLERIGTKMPDDMLDRIVDEMATFTTPFLFSPFKVNEPFLDKRLMPLCRKFNERVPRGALRLFTNGSALTQSHIDGVAALERVVHLWISLNEHEADKYEATMGLSFAHTARNLDRLHESVTRGEFPHRVVVSRVGAARGFREYVSQRWPLFQVAFIKHDAWIDFTYADDLEVPNAPCVRWWELNITASGKASLCCMDSTGDYGFGDLRDSTLLEIYNHPTYRSWREGLMSRRDVGNPCHRCTY